MIYSSERDLAVQNYDSKAVNIISLALYSCLSGL